MLFLFLSSKIFKKARPFFVLVLCKKGGVPPSSLFIFCSLSHILHILKVKSSRVKKGREIRRMNTRIAASSHSRCGGATRAPQSAILTRGGKTSTTATTTSSRTHFFREHRTTAPTRRRRQETKTRRSISSSASNTEGAAKVTNENDWDADQLMRSSLRLYDTPDCRNLLVVGPGVLGSLVCQKWLEMFPAAIVVGQTNSTKNHERLEKMGITARTEGAFEYFDPKSFPYVVFSAPPSGSDDYPGEIKKALEKWNGKNRHSGFCFTSSSAVFPDNIDCDDDTATLNLGKNPRADRLLNAENVVFEHENRKKENEIRDNNEREEGKDKYYKNRAAVLRLAGLYHSSRGAHTYFIKAGTIDSRPDALVNCIHYEDAADLVVKVLLREDAQRNIFLGCDGHPITREDVATCALESGCFDDDGEEKHIKPKFTKSEGPVGRRMTCKGTEKALDWTPKYTSFRDFFDKDTNKGYDSFVEESSPFGWNHSTKSS